MVSETAPSGGRFRMVLDVTVLAGMRPCGTDIRLLIDTIAGRSPVPTPLPRDHRLTA